MVFTQCPDDNNHRLRGYRIPCLHHLKSKTVISEKREGSFVVDSSVILHRLVEVVERLYAT